MCIISTITTVRLVRGIPTNVTWQSRQVPEKRSWVDNQFFVVILRRFLGNYNTASMAGWHADDEQTRTDVHASNPGISVQRLDSKRSRPTLRPRGHWDQFFCEINSRMPFLERHTLHCIWA